MDAELKQRWLKALRSGDYDQITGQLRKPHEGHCCLGVLADLLDPDGWQDSTNWHGGWSSLPPNKSEPIGLNQRTAQCLANKNDSGATFEEIADWIEANL